MPPLGLQDLAPENASPENASPVSDGVATTGVFEEGGDDLGSFAGSGFSDSDEEDYYPDEDVQDAKSNEEVQTEDTNPAGDSEMLGHPCVGQQEDLPREQTDDIETETTHQSKRPRLSVEFEDVAPERSSSNQPSGISRTKQHTSPEDILLPLSPYPACLLALSFKDHRWVARWRKKVDCEQWIDELSNKSFSMTFNYRDPDDWKRKLQLVHQNAWNKWSIGKDFISGLDLQDGISEQEPGNIPDQAFPDLAPLLRTCHPNINM